MAVYITGDIHGDPGRFSSKGFPDQKALTKDDFVIILGDFGLVWDYNGESSTEKYWLDWLSKKPFTTLFLDGNHENFDRLDAYPVSSWHGGSVHFIRPSVIHLMRGQVFDIENHSFFAFGGARSHDISDGILDPDDPDFTAKKKRLDDRYPFSMYRVNRRSWWEQEMPDEKEMAEGRKNLAEHDNRVNYVLTHSPCTSLFAQMGTGSYQKDRLTDYLQEIKETISYGAWFFGHMHRNYAFPHEKSQCLYKHIVRIL